MNVINTKLDGVKIIEPKIFSDSRGFFYESFQKQRYLEHGITLDFVQDNISTSTKGVLRGLHYQLEKPQGKLIMVMVGEVFDVAVDIRTGSPTFGEWLGVELSENNSRQLYIPPGFAHGFCVTSEVASFTYKCTDYYNPGDEYSILWSDADIGIDWPVDNPSLSEKDAVASSLQEMQDSLPKYIAD